MNKIFIATKNKGKVKEIISVLNSADIEFSLLEDRPDIPEIPETGSTFEENAFIKAKVVYEIVNIPVLADDSGLEVDHLNGAPGVFSARYSGEGATDKQNCEKLLHELEGAEPEERSARFKCVLVLFDGENKKVFEGFCEGSITTSPQGEGGFGYDPLFQPAGYTKTFGELGPEIKNKISHRGKALALLKDSLTGI